MTNPIRPTTDEARTLAKSLVSSARHAALGVLHEQAPMVTRVVIGWINTAPHLLVSNLSMHTKLLAQNPACSLLVGEPETKGDPLTHPRLTLQCTAHDTDKPPLRAPWLALHPKSKLYIDFADFKFLRLTINSAYLNGGFGQAFHLNTSDLT